MKLLLTSSGISNPSIEKALLHMLGKPFAEANALFIPTAIYPFSQGGTMAWKAVSGHTNSRLAQLGWKSLGILELTALPSICGDTWIPMVKEADALLFWGGDPLYLSYWMKHSGLTDVIPALRPDSVYVGVSGGSMVAARIFGETFTEPPHGSGEPISSDKMLLASPSGEISRTFVIAKGAGLVDFAVIPHFQNPDHPDASATNAATWASRIPSPVYAIDDQTAIKVEDGRVEVISEGVWRLFTPPAERANR